MDIDNVKFAGYKNIKTRNGNALPGVFLHTKLPGFSSPCTHSPAQQDSQVHFLCILVHSCAISDRLGVLEHPQHPPWLRPCPSPHPSTSVHALALISGRNCPSSQRSLPLNTVRIGDVLPLTSTFPLYIDGTAGEPQVIDH